MDRNEVFCAISNKSIESVKDLCIEFKKKLCGLHSVIVLLAGTNRCNAQNLASENQLPGVSCSTDKLGTFAKRSVGCSNP